MCKSGDGGFAMRPFLAVCGALIVSVALVAQERRGAVTGVTATPTGDWGTVRFTVRGNNPCGAVFIEFGDGKEGITYPISELPATVTREYYKTGRFNVSARGMGNCDGSAPGTVEVTRARPEPPPPPTPAPAQPARPEAQPAPAIRFADMDTNNDRVISRAEWRGTAREFTAHDWDADGRLSGDEVRRFEDLDRDGNGRVERREWQGSMNTFRTLDANTDGTLSRVELGAEAEAVRPGRGLRGGFAREAPRVVVVPATREIDTGIDVSQGDLIEITATGRIFFMPGLSGSVGPNGQPGQKASPNAPLGDREIGALIGRINENHMFVVGERYSQRAEHTGRLLLRINDDVLTDNRGEFRATITITRR